MGRRRSPPAISLPRALAERTSHAKGSAGLFPSPALSERCHRSLARRLVAVRRCAVFEVAIGQRPKPWRAHGRGGGLEDAADNHAVGNHVVVILAPLAGWARDRGALEREIIFVHVSSSTSRLSRPRRLH